MKQHVLTIHIEAPIEGGTPIHTAAVLAKLKEPLDALCAALPDHTLQVKQGKRETEASAPRRQAAE